MEDIADQFLDEPGYEYCDHGIPLGQRCLDCADEYEHEVEDD